MLITGAIYITGAFTQLVAGLYWNGASRVGAYLALVVGLSAVLGLKPLQEAVQKILGVELEWDSEIIGISTVAASSLVMVLGSLAFPDRRDPGAEYEAARMEVTT